MLFFNRFNGGTGGSILIFFILNFFQHCPESDLVLCLLGRKIAEYTNPNNR